MKRKYSGNYSSNAKRATDGWVVAARPAGYKSGPRPRSAIVSMRSARSLPWPETKYFDTSFSQTVSSAADWTGSEVPCTNYIQSDGTTVGSYTDSALIPSATGAGYGQVVGSKYKIKKLRIRGEIGQVVMNDQADMVNGCVTRIVLVMDTQPNGAQAQGEEVFTDMGTAGQNSYSFLAMAAGAGGRFRILKDKWITCNPAASGTDGTNTNSIGFNKARFSLSYTPRYPVTVRTKASAATPAIAALSDVNIFLLAHAGNATTTMSLIGCARCYYTD